MLLTGTRICERALWESPAARDQLWRGVPTTPRASGGEGVLARRPRTFRMHDRSMHAESTYDGQVYYRGRLECAYHITSAAISVEECASNAFPLASEWRHAPLVRRAVVAPFFCVFAS